MAGTKTFPFLPSQFQSETNKKFLNATVDQLVTAPNVKPISGYIGRKFAPGNNDITNYIRENNTIRAAYQLEPGIVVKDSLDEQILFKVSYPEFLQQLNYLNANIADPNKLFSNDYYSYNPYIDPDKFINFGEYYWLPNGPDAVNIVANVDDFTRTYYVNLNADRQIVFLNGFDNVQNPSIILTRGGVYQFVVNQKDHKFWIQTDPGTSGYQINNNNISSRQVLGVSNNGDDVGTVTFSVPVQTAQDQFINMNMLQNVDLATSLNYSQLQGQLLTDIVNNYGGIDGQRDNLNDKFIILTGNSQNNADWTAGAVTIPANQRYGIWKINLTVVGIDTYFNLVFQQTIPVNNKVTIQSGVTNGNTQWYTDANFQIVKIPIITANLDNLYYQIGDIAEAVGTIKIVDSGSNVIDIETEILGKVQYQSPNNIKFTNGLKVKFGSDVIPTEYQNKQYYVDGVGTAIRLVDVNSLIFNPTQSSSNYDPTQNFTDSATADLTASKDQFQITTNVNPITTLVGNFPNAANPYTILPQDLDYNYPYRGGQNTQGDHASIVFQTGSVAISIVGVPIFGKVNGWTVPGLNGTTWNLVSQEAKVNGEDAYSGTVDSNGLYHYVGSDFITANAWGNVSGFTTGYTQTDGHSKIIGYAADGYPIYGPFGYLNALDGSSPVVRMSSSYQSNDTGDSRPASVTVTLTANTTANSYITVASTFGLNPGMRATVNTAGLPESQYWILNLGLATATGPDLFPGGINQIQLNGNVTVTQGSTITFEYLAGVFVEDWAFVPNSGTLDQYNGRYCVTPEFPNGTYAYFATQNISNQPVYPYFIGQAYYGSVSVDPITSLLDPDYLTINRSSRDLNAWSRRNRWFHRDVVYLTSLYNATNFILDSRAKATRPIIEFDPDLQLYNFGKVAKRPVDIFDTQTTAPFLTVEGVAGVYLDQTFVSEGMRIIFAADEDPATRNKIWQVTYIDQDANIVTPKIIHLVPADDGVVDTGETVAVFSGVNNINKTFWFNGTVWVQGQAKTIINQAPLFDIFDNSGFSLGDQTKYPISNNVLGFNGTKLFGYVVGSGTNDPILGFPLSYQNLNNIGDIKFQNYFATDTFTYSIDRVDYTKPVNIGFIHKNTSLTQFNILNTWNTVNYSSKQYQLFSFIFDGIENIFNIDIEPAANVIDKNFYVYKNFTQISQDKYRIYAVPNGNYQVWIDPTVIKENDRITVRVYSNTVSNTAYYEIPINLNNNLLNSNYTVGTLGDLRNHFNASTVDNLNFIGKFPGNSNLRDLSIDNNTGTILQHSSPLSYAMMFLTSEQYNFVNSVNYAQQEYIKFKNKFLNLSETGSRVASWTAVEAVDNILTKINEFKTKDFPYYYSGMVPFGKDRNDINYTVFDPDKTTYSLSSIYDPTSLSNKAVLVYLNGTQLLYGQDYLFSTTIPAIVFDNSLNLAVNDEIEIYEFNNTDGCCIPETPTKLGLYPKFTPETVVDNTYTTTQTFIRGHDGSLTPVFGDFRDDLLLELERRIYNNIKVTFDNRLVDIFKAKPGKFRTNDFTVRDYNRLIADTYLPWVGFNKLNYTNNTTFQLEDLFTYNYGLCADKLDGELLPGSWRACYEYYYDTQRPNTNPWEMLGFSQEPDWWQATYGPAPYTSGNEILWNDLEQGYIAAGSLQGFDSRFARPGLSNYIPVDVNGNLKPPLGFLTIDYSKKVNGNWLAGQYSPVETAWRNSSNYPYAVQIILALTDTAKYFTQGASTNFIEFNSILNQFINAATNQRLVPADITVNGYNYSTNAIDRSTSYINWIAEFLTSKGIVNHSSLTNFIQKYDVNLMYRMAGYTNKNTLKVLADQNSPQSINESIVIPDGDFNLILNKSTPIQKLRYSAVVIEKVSDGFKISGYDNENPYFNIVLPETNDNLAATSIAVNKLQVKWYKKYRSVRASIPYGSVLSDIQQVANFFAGYQRYFSNLGVRFDDFDTNLGQLRNWELSTKEFLFWVQQNWASGSVIIFNPCAANFTFFSTTSVVDAVSNDITGSRIQTQNWNILSDRDYTVTREFNDNGNLFRLSLVDQNNQIGLFTFNTVQYEHALIFNNVTQFNDVIYAPQSGQRQYRLKLIGTKTQSWTGAVNPPGYIYFDGKVITWTQNTDYLRGDLVEYKGLYYTANTNIPGGEVFDFTQWSQEPTSAIQAGLLENYAARANKNEFYYNVDKVNLELDEDNLAYSLIGYKNRNYLVELGLTDTSQIKFYQGFIKQKGTKNAINAFGNVIVNNQSTALDINEEWAFRVGDYGATDINRFVEITLNEEYILNNPSSLEVAANNVVTYNSLYNNVQGIYDYSTQTFASPFLLNRTNDSVRTDDIKTAGYVNIDDVDFTLFNLSDISTLNGELKSINVGSVIWVAQNYTNDWDVYKIESSAVQLLSVKNVLNNTISILTGQPHNYNKDDTVILTNIDRFSGFYRVKNVVDNFNFTVEVLGNITGFSAVTFTQPGSGYRLQSLRVNYANQIFDIADITSWNAGDLAWVNYSDDNRWAVYEKSEPWTANIQMPKSVYTTDGRFGTSVKISNDNNFALIGEPGTLSGQGSATNYVIGFTNTFVEDITVSPSAANSVAFGSSLDTGQDFVVIGAPNSASGKGYAYVYQRNFLGTIAETQVLAAPSGNAEAFGSSVVISDDDAWIYIGAEDASKVYAYGYYDAATPQSVTLATTTGNASYSLGFTAVSTELLYVRGSVYTYVPFIDFTVTGSTITFTNPANDTVVVRQNPGYIYVDVLSFANTGSNFGAALAHTTDGRQLAVGAPKDNNASGTVTLYDRSVEKFISIADQTLFGGVRTLGLVHKVYVNDILQELNVDYVIVAVNWIQLSTAPEVGSIVTIETNQFNKILTVNASLQQNGSEFGFDIDICSNNCSLYIGAPYFSQGTNYNVGSAYRFVNQGRIYGTITGTVQNPTVAGGDSIRLNDYEVDFSGTSLISVVNTINAANIPGITAASVNGYLQINSNSEIALNKLTVLPGIGSALTDLGLQVFVQTEKIDNPTNNSYDLFGYSVKIDNSSEILGIGGPTARTLTSTTFDVYRNLIINSQTLFGTPYVTNPRAGLSESSTTFDGASTTFVDKVQSGAAWILSYLPDSRQTISHPGKFLYVQQLDPAKLSINLVPNINFGAALDIGNGELLVSAITDSQFEINNGVVYKFINTDRLNGWDVIRNEDDKVDIDSIIKSYIYDNENNLIIDYLDYIDPVKGKILGLAEQELSYKVDYDPAVYNNSSTSQLKTSSTLYWGSQQLGQVWWDLSTVRYLEYEQDSIKYRTTNWGRTFPGSSIDVYEWVESLYPPSQYIQSGGNGIPKYINDSAYVTETFIDPVTNFATVRYYFWVKDKTSTPSDIPNRTLPVSVIRDYIRNPKNSGVKYFAAIKDNAVALYNINTDIVGDTTVFHLDYASIINSAIIHSEYQLISENSKNSDVIPTKLYNKLVDSTAGIDAAGNTVPDPSLPVAKRYGIEVRPRQSMYINKNLAVEQMVTFVNTIFTTTTFANGFDLTTLSSGEPLPPPDSGFYDITVNTYDELTYIDIITKPVGYKVLVLSNSEIDNLWTVYVKDTAVTLWTANTAFLKGQVISYENTAYTATANFTSSSTFNTNNLTLYQVNNNWFLYQVQTYKTTDYWDTVDWYAEYFDNTTQPKYTFNNTADMVNATFKSGDVVKILNNGQNKWMLLQIFANTSVMVGLQDGTIKLKDSLYETESNGIGFGNDNFDTKRFDQNAGIELRKIIQALKEDLLINQYSFEFVKLFFVLINYVLEEQKSVDWVFKTSFIDIIHKIRGLDQPEIYYRENQTYLQQYVEEVKPYHSTIREYIVDYQGVDNYNGYVSDFDLPAYYDPVLKQYRSPSGDFAQDITALTLPQYADYLNSFWYSIEEIIIADAGTGYTVAPAITITGSTIGDNAVARASIKNGQLTKIEILYPGSNYITQPIITLSGGNGTGGKLYAKLVNTTTRKVKTTLVYDRYTFAATVQEWLPFTTYTAGSIIAYNNIAYVVNITFTSGASFSGNNLSIYPAYKFKTANDRIAAYYNPTVGMPGKNPALLQTGIDYPGVVIEGPLFTDAGGFDVAAFDTEYFDALQLDSDGTYVISDLILDSKIESDFTDSSLGQRPEDIIIDGDDFVTPYTSHAPEELIPGRVYDTLEFVVSTFTTLEDTAYLTWAGNTGFFISEILVADPGSGYSANAVVNIVGDTGSGATANIVVNANGSITGVTVTTAGGGYSTVPNVTINSNTGANANLDFSTAKLTAVLDQSTYNTFTFRMFKDMNDNWTYLREDPSATTTLASNVTITSNTITVANSAVLFEPKPAMNLPGVIYINGERITYFTKNNATNTLGQLRRGTLGTGANVHYTGDTVTSGSLNQTVPDSYHIANTFVSNATLQMTNGIYRNFLAGQTYIQTNLWLSSGTVSDSLVSEFDLVANVDIPFITTESNLDLAVDQLSQEVANGLGLYGSTKIQALFVKKQVGA